MLIGPTISLKELEEHIKEQIYANNNEKNKLVKRLNEIQFELQETPKLIEDEDGKRVVNNRFLELKEELEQGQQRIEEIQDSNDFMAAKLTELEDIEERSGGKINKEKEKITLSLNDCLLLGVTTGGE